MDERLAAGRRIESLASWWAQASEKARFEALKVAYGPKAPYSLEEIHIAALLAESEQGTVAQG